MIIEITPEMTPVGLLRMLVLDLDEAVSRERRAAEGVNPVPDSYIVAARARAKVLQAVADRYRAVYEREEHHQYQLKQAQRYDEHRP